MDKKEFTYLLNNPDELTDDHTEAIGEIIERYPYFQAARALNLKVLKTKASFKYNQELRVTAAYTTDRSILFDFITSETFNQNEISQLIKQNIELLNEIEVHDANDISITKKGTNDNVLNQYIKDNEAVLDPNLFQEKPTNRHSEDDVNIQMVNIDIKNIAPTAEEKLNLGKPLDFDKNENHSFSEWLKITSFKPIERPDKATEKTPATEDLTADQDIKTENGLGKKLDLIDRFLKTNPKISPIKQSASPITIPTSKLVQNDSLMTETLARIYLEQKNYDKAIQSYKILILKYPEKSAFFADQIKAVKQIQENNTK